MSGYIFIIFNLNTFVCELMGNIFENNEGVKKTSLIFKYTFFPNIKFILFIKKLPFINKVIWFSIQLNVLSTLF